MIDKFGRKIEYARISLTDRCNLRCKYCMPECGVKKISHDEILRFEEILFVTKIFDWLGIKKIRLTGGEPLLRKNICELIFEMKKIPGIEQIFLTTNGVNLKNLAENLISAGLDGINLSLDTLNEKIFKKITRRNDFEKVFDGLQILLEKNFPVKINCVPIKNFNDGEILKIARLAEKNFIKVRFIELMPIGYAKNFQGISTSEIFAELEKNFGKLEPVEEKNNLCGPAKYFSIKNFVGQIGFIDSLEHKFCRNCNRIKLTAEGFLKPCLNFSTGLDVKNLLRNNFGEEKILREIEKIIYNKPLEHNFEKSFGDARKMYQIGG